MHLETISRIVKLLPYRQGVDIRYADDSEYIDKKNLGLMPAKEINKLLSETRRLFWTIQAIDEEAWNSM